MKRNRAGISYFDLPFSKGEEVKGVQKFSGHWFFNFSFPFFHKSKDKIYIFTANRTYIMEE